MFSNDGQNIHKLITTVYSKWLSETYGISSSPPKIEGCDLVKQRLRFKLLQDKYQPKFIV